MTTTHHTHGSDCYGYDTLPCPQCSEPVRQQRLQCGTDRTISAQCIKCSLACQDCKSEVRVTEGAKLLRARVIHDAECPWFRRYQAREVTGAIPCRTFVTHRGPYVRDPEAAGEERQAS